VDFFPLCLDVEDAPESGPSRLPYAPRVLAVTELAAPDPNGPLAPVFNNPALPRPNPPLPPGRELALPLCTAAASASLS
jgi:hypothetical protein